MDHKPLLIVLVEDDDGHATLIRRNLERGGLGAELVRLREGGEALEYLRNQFAEGAPRQMLVLLDIRMQGMDGTEVLRRLKSDPALRILPVYMLTTTDNPTEVERCFELGCNAYLMKPVSYEEFSTAIQRLSAFLEVSQIPQGPPRQKYASA